MSTGYSRSVTWQPALDANGKPIRANFPVPEPAASRRSRLVKDILTHLSGPDVDPITALVEMVVDLQDSNAGLEDRIGSLERDTIPGMPCRCGKCHK